MPLIPQHFVCALQTNHLPIPEFVEYPICFQTNIATFPDPGKMYLCCTNKMFQDSLNLETDNGMQTNQHSRISLVWEYFVCVLQTNIPGCP